MSRASAGFTSSDYEALEQRFDSEKVYKLADVKDKIERVAFDVVRFRDSEGLDKLWVVQDRDGEQVLVAMYEDDDGTQKEAHASNWAAVNDNAGNVSVYYKREPIVRVAMSKLGLPNEDAPTVSRYLPKKLSSDKELTTALLGELSASERETLFAKYPELRG